MDGRQQQGADHKVPTMWNAWHILQSYRNNLETTHFFPLCLQPRCIIVLFGVSIDDLTLTSTPFVAGVLGAMLFLEGISSHSEFQGEDEWQNTMEKGL